MKFYITRASCYSRQIQPVEEARRDSDGRWFIEINSLEGYVGLKDKYGPTTLDHDNEGNYCITINDDWSSEA